MTKLLTLVIGSSLIASCAAKTPQPSTHVVYKERLVEVLKPCVNQRPERPKPLDRPLPDNTSNLVDVLVAKLLEWSGPGGYGDKADAALALCSEEVSSK